jgi:hypothetical protein
MVLRVRLKELHNGEPLFVKPKSCHAVRDNIKRGCVGLLCTYSRIKVLFSLNAVGAKFTA